MTLAGMSTSLSRAPDAGAVVQRSCTCGGSCPSCAAKNHARATRSEASRIGHGRDFTRVPATRHAVVRIGPADDPLEREADRVADAVASHQPARVGAGRIAHVQRAMDEEGGGEPATAGDVDVDVDVDADDETDGEGVEEDEAEDYDDPTGQPKLADGAFRGGGRAELPLGASAGAAIEEPVRSSMERGIGHDFSGVRIHTDAAAGRAAASIHANAFTLGRDIYFADGAYTPASSSGRRLLAHELAHVVQQSDGRPSGAVQRQVARPGRRRRRPVPPPSAGPPRRRRATSAERRCTVHGRPGKKPCGPSTCDGQCSSPVNPFAHNPCCGNETCGPSAAVDPSFFIRHLDVDLSTQMTTAEWGTRTRTLAVSTFLTSPNASATPPGPHTIDQKCGACHTNGDGEGMAWLAGFVGIQFGFHDSQRVARGTSSHGCVRVSGCACAREIHDHTWSGVTSVCVHTGRHCGRPQPGAGAVDPTHTSHCGTLHLAAAAAPSGPSQQTPPRPRSTGGGGAPREREEGEPVS